MLIFKSKKLDVLNISQTPEFLEDSKPFMGVKIPGAICKTPFGVAFINKYGLYLYDGSTIHNLLENKKGMPRMSSKDWETEIKDTAIVGYVPRDKCLLIKCSSAVSDTTSTTKFYIYNFDLDSLSEATAMAGVDQDNASNFVTLSDGRLILSMDHAEIKEYSGDPYAVASSSYLWKTKTFNFGDKSKRKKIYKVYVTFKCNNTTTNVMVKFNKLCEHDHNCGSPGYSENHSFANGTNFSGNKLVATDANEWNVAELKPATSALANNVKTFQLVFSASSTVPTEFEVSDIQIIYRDKSTK